MLIKQLAKSNMLLSLRQRLADEMLFELTPDELSAYMLQRHNGDMRVVFMYLSIVRTFTVEWHQLCFDLAWQFKWVDINKSNET